jgi:hypothetical protein
MADGSVRTVRHPASGTLSGLLERSAVRGPRVFVARRGGHDMNDDQAWFHTPDWQAGEREASEDIHEGRVTRHEDVDRMFDHLDGVPPV